MASSKAQEIWEATTAGTTYVTVRDPRNPEGWTKKKVGGKGTKRITLTVEEREFNQELVPFEKEQYDPFQNGKLVRIHPVDAARGENELTDDDLVAMLKADEETFGPWLEDIGSEVIVRRVYALAREHATVTRYEAIRDLVEDRYHVGKTSKVVREIMADDAKYAGADF